MASPRRPGRRDFMEQALLLSIGMSGAGLAAALLHPQTTAEAADVLTQILDRQRRTVFNVRLRPYLARGDGVGNDGPAIQAAIDDAAAAGGGVVYLPAGVYLLGSVQQQAGVRYFLLNFRSGVTLAGDGRHLTTMKAPAGVPDQTRIISASSADGKSAVTDAVFRDFTIDGQADKQPDARSCVGISNVHTNGVAHLGVRVVAVKGTATDEGTCFDSYSSVGNFYRDCEAVQPARTSTGSGFSATDARGVTYQDCRAGGSAHWQGFTTFRSSQIQYSNCHGYANAQRGLNCESSQDVTYINCLAGGDAGENRGDGIYIFHSERVSVTNCTSLRNRNGLMNIGSSVRVVRGRFSDNVGAGIAFGSDEDSRNSSVEDEPAFEANGFGPTWTAPAPA